VRMPPVAATARLNAVLHSRRSLALRRALSSWLGAAELIDEEREARVQAERREKEELEERRERWERAMSSPSGDLTTLAAQIRLCDESCHSVTRTQLSPARPKTSTTAGSRATSVRSTPKSVYGQLDGMGTTPRRLASYGEEMAVLDLNWKRHERRLKLITMVPASSRQTPPGRQTLTPPAAHFGVSRSANTNPCGASIDRSVAISTCGSIDGRHVDSRHVDSRHVDSRHVDGRHVDSRHVDSRHVDGRHIDGPVDRPNGRPADEPYHGTPSAELALSPRPSEECCEEDDCREGPPEEGQQLHTSVTSSVSSLAPPAAVNPSSASGQQLHTSAASSFTPLHEELQRQAWLRLSRLRAEKEAERHNQLASVYWRYRPPGAANEWQPPWSRHATPSVVMTPWGGHEDHGSVYSRGLNTDPGVREVSPRYRRGRQLLKHDREAHAKRGSIHPRRCMFMVGNQEFAFMDGVNESNPRSAR